MPKPITIPRKEQENALYLLWVNATALETHVEIGSHAIDRINVEGAYNFLNRVGYTDARPGWEEREARAKRLAQQDEAALVVAKMPVVAGYRKMGHGLPPEGVVVDTLINDGLSQRNEQPLKRQGNLWFVPNGSSYVYYTPTHWRYQS